MCCPLVFEFSVGIGGFVIGLGQISFLFSFGDFLGALFSDGISEHILVIFSSYFVHSFRMMTGTCPESFRTNCR